MSRALSQSRLLYMHMEMSAGSARRRARAADSSNSTGTVTRRPWRTPRSAMTCRAKSLDIAQRASQHADLHTTVMVEVHVHGSD